jgi:hypothetical protein
MSYGYVNSDAKSGGYSVWPVRSSVPASKGDVNNDGQVNLTDTVLALRVIAGISPQQIVYKEADINGDGKIGLPEAIYILQKVTGMR